MDNCFGSCGCDDRQGISKSDLDRFTDKIENVLNDEKGRRLFRNYMRTCNMKDGRKKLDVLDRIDQFINKKVEDEESSLQSLLHKAQRIEELDFALMERLYTARNSQNKEAMTEALMDLKTEIIKALDTEYDIFKKRYTPSKSK